MGKKRNKRTLELKKIRRLSKQLDELYEQRRKLPLIKLDKSIHKGYYKTYRLRSQYLEGPDKDLWSTLLNICNNTVYSANKSFVEKRYVKGRGYAKEKIELYPRPITSTYAGRLIYRDKKNWYFVPPELVKYFKYGSKYVYKHIRPGGKYFHEKEWVHGWSPYNMFFAKEVRRKYYITHVQQIDPELESKIRKLEDYIWNFNEGKYYKAFSRGRHWDDWNINKMVVSERVRKKEMEEYRKEFLY